MVDKIKVKPGTLFTIELAENSFVAGIVLHVSKIFKAAVMVGIYDQIFESEETIEFEKLVNFFDEPNYTGKKILTAGDWKVIGFNQALLDAAELPELAIVHHIYYKDEVIKHYPPEEREIVRQYPRLLGQGKGSVEIKLRKHFGLD